MLYKFFQKIEPTLKRLYKKLSEPPIPNLKGDRDIEYSWIAANMPDGPGEALDFGSGPSYMGLIAVRKGFKVTAIDLEKQTFFFEHPDFKFVQGDLFKLNLPKDHFDLIINCSAIEHVGLAGIYSVVESRPDGDIEAMSILRSILKPGGIMLMTIPVGVDKVFMPFHRVYGKKRIPLLLNSWEVVKEEFWIKDSRNLYICVEREKALNTEPLEYCYGLGLFVLRKPEKE